MIKVEFKTIEEIQKIEQEEGCHYAEKAFAELENIQLEVKNE